MKSNKEIKSGMKIKLTPAIGDDSFWTKYIGKTFEVDSIDDFNIYLTTPKGCRHPNTSVNKENFWEFFALADQQLEFDFGKKI